MSYLHLVVPVAATLSFAPTGAAAEEGPRELFGQPVNQPPAPSEEELAARAAAFEAGLAQRGLKLIGTQVVPQRVLDDPFALPPGVSEAGEWTLPPHRQTIFLNFFGGKLSNGNNAAEGQSPCVQQDIDYPGFTDGEQDALAVIQVFKDAAEPFGLRVAYDKVPPKHLPYSQVLMGGSPGLIGLPNGVLGVACNLDCADLYWRDSTFAFTEQSNDINVLATTALQEAAHAWGLDHIDGAQNIMYPYATPGKKVWADTCTPYNAATGPIGCQGTHDKFCDGGAQNDVAELTAFFGVNSPDTIPPTVTMLSPMDGQQFKSGDKVHVEVEVSDDHEGFGWRLMVPELGQEIPVYDSTKSWDFPVPKGAFTIRVEAIDHDRNVGFAEAKIYVDVTPEPPDPDTDTDTDTAGETGTAPTTGDDPTGGSAGEGGEASGGESSGEPTAGEDPDDKGCGCRHDGASLAPLGLVALLGLRRRRR
jgi:MYXO-CTERM domain-containing protein